MIKIYSKRRLLAVLMSFAMLFCSIPNGAEAAKKKLKATSPKTVVVNKSIKIKTNMKCKFKSSKKKIATVNSKGVVKGKKAGNVKITVTAKKSKQKKILKIAVKKPCINRRTPAPKANETQSPQVDVTQSPKPPEEASQTPSVPGKSSDPATESPDIPKTPNPPTLTPDVPASETPSVTSTPGPIGTETPDVPKTPGPSVTPEPTSTATPSPTNPSQTKQPIGITAEFKGKVPMDKATGDTYPSIFNVSKWSGIIVKLAYADNTERILKSTEFSMPFGEVIEKNGKQFVENVITYENFSTTLQVEIVAVDSDVIYPSNMHVNYIGDTLKEGEAIDINDLEVYVRYSDETSKIIDANQITVEWLTDNGDEKVYTCAYNYYFEYNGELLHICMAQDIYVPYE